MNIYYILALITSVLYGVATIIEKHVMTAFEPSYVFTMFGLLYGLIAVYSYFYNATLFKTYAGKTYLTHHIWLFMAAMCALILPQLMFLNALKHQENIHVVSALSSLGPLVTVLLLILLFRKKITCLSVTGTILVVIGGIILLTTK